jgi:diguanylate cyclase (GGDEF)-like protein
MHALVRPTIVLALAYWAVGFPAIHLAIPPGYTAPFFPSAGIALAALLVYGLRLWPGVLIGSALIQLATTWPLLGTPGWSPLGPLAVPIGATLQAVIGTLLVRRLVGSTDALDTASAVMRFLALCVPVSALVGSTIAVTALVHAGVIPAADAFFNGWTWWTGDTLGMLIAAPLALTFIGRPEQNWRPRRLGVALPMAIALALLTLAYQQIVNREESRLQVQFERDSAQLAGLLKKQLDVQVDMVHAIEGLVLASDRVTRDDFTLFVEPWMDRHPGTRSFTWNPSVAHALRSAFEAAMRAQGLEGYEIRDRDANGRTTPAAPRTAYLPVAYVTPADTNDAVLGMDPLSYGRAAETIARALQTRQPAATESVRLVQDADSERGVVLYHAVYDHGAQTTPARLRGVISAAFRMDDLLAAVIERATQLGIEVCLVDVGGTAAAPCLAGTRLAPGASWPEGSVSRVEPIAFAGRDWALHNRALPQYAESQRSWAAWGTVAVGLLATGMLGAVLLIGTGNKRRIQALVDQRTAELEAAGLRLQENQQALVDAQRIARLGSWETVAGLQGLRTSAGLRLLLDNARSPLASIDELLQTIAAGSRADLAEAIERAAHESGRIVLDCTTDCLPLRTLQFRIEGEHAHGQLVRIRGTAQDVTALREAEARIRYLARYDTLTGLLNRSAWKEHAQEILRHAARHEDRCAILFLDLDDFKTVNDSLGHAAGDRLLAEVATRLGACVREEDPMARLGGDEFVVLLSRLTLEDEPARVAERMLAALARPMQIEGHQLQLSASIGIALYPSDGSEIDSLLKHADTAMYDAKASGRNAYRFFLPEMSARATRRLQTEAELRRAIEGGELILHYQPQVAAGGSLGGCEALVRWQHPERGLLSPDHFIPFAEQSGQIVPLGDWVLREACQQQVRWREAGLAVPMVAVNISALQFRREDFVATVKRVLDETGANPAELELEITESALMDASPDLVARFEELVGLGLTLALDDFGTGYSSLSYLKRLPISRLKIDRSFVDGLPDNPEDVAITSATLSLARDLGMDVVAEGVETEAQRGYLGERRCTAMQGYLFSPPLGVTAFGTWVAAHATSPS